MDCEGCVSELSGEVAAYIHKIEAQHVLLCGCAVKLLDKFKKDASLKGKDFKLESGMADLAVLFGGDCSVGAVQGKLTVIQSEVGSVLVYFYVGQCERGMEGRNSDFWLDFLGKLFGKAVFLSKIGGGFVLEASSPGIKHKKH